MKFFSEEKSVSAIETNKRALSGDQAAIQLYAEFGFHLGQAIKSMLYAYDPEIIILGGSLTKAFDLFKPAMLDAIRDFDYPSVLTNLKIEISELEHSAIYGAAALYLNSDHS